MGRAGLRRARRRRAHARGLRCVGAGDAVRGRRGAAARADARRARRRAACACCARRGRSSSRSSCSTTPRRCSSGRPASRRSTVEEGGVRTRAWPIEAGEVTIDTPLADRRRPSPLRDGRRLPRGEPERDAHVRGARLVARARGRDLPDAPARPGARRRSRRAGRRPNGGVTLYRDNRFTRVATDDDFGPRVVESFAPARRLVHRVRRRGDRRRRPRRRGGRVPARAGHRRAGRAVRARRRGDAAEVDVLLSRS